MIKKSKRNKKSEGVDTSWLKTGLDADDLQRELKKSGGSGDPELLFIYDGDIVQMTIVTKPQQWVTFGQHFIGGKVGFKLCSNDGCLYCDDGLNPSQRTMIGVYVNHLAQASRGDFKAKRTKDVGYKFLTLNKETAETFLRIAKRRGGKLNDYIYIIERTGSTTDTKYDVERSDKPTKKRHVRGWDKDIVKKLIAMKAREDESDDDVNDDDDDDDYDYEPKKKKSNKNKKKSRRR